MQKKKRFLFISECKVSSAKPKIQKNERNAKEKTFFFFLFTNTTGAVPLCFLQRLRFRQLEHGDQSHATLRHFHLFRCERKISPTFLFPCWLHCSDGFQHIFEDTAGQTRCVHAVFKMFSDFEGKFTQFWANLKMFLRKVWKNLVFSWCYTCISSL